MKSVITGVSITPELGLEVAQIDFSNQIVLKYGVKPIEYDMSRQEVADIDIFKETLQDLFLELGIPKKSPVVINLPTSSFKIQDFPASWDEPQIMNEIEKVFEEGGLFNDTEPGVGAVLLPSVSMQFNKVAYTAAPKTFLIELAMIIKDLGYTLLAINTSLNSVVNALMYKERVNTEANTIWAMLLIDNVFCRVILMNGKSYVDSYEERIRIGEVLGDAENYATVINSAEPILKNIPASYLCVVSKTNIISAEVLASKIKYSAPIIYQEANSFSREAFFEVSQDVNPDYSRSISLDAIGACLNLEYGETLESLINLFNKTLGEVYTSEQPPEINLNGRTIVLRNSLLIKLALFLAIVVIALTVAAFVVFTGRINEQNSKLSSIENEIAQANKFLEENNKFSADLFDEGDEIKKGLQHNKGIYSYYTIVGTEIPKKLWLTYLKLSDKVTVLGQSDNLESIYSFFRNIKDYDPESSIKLQSLGLATESRSNIIPDDMAFDTDSLLSSVNADFYEFRISNEAMVNSNDIKKSDGLEDLPGLN